MNASPLDAGDSQERGGGRSGRGRRARAEVTPGAAVPEPVDTPSNDAASDAGSLEARGARSPYAELSTIRATYLWIQARGSRLFRMACIAWHETQTLCCAASHPLMHVDRQLLQLLWKQSADPSTSAHPARYVCLHD